MKKIIIMLLVVATLGCKKDKLENCLVGKYGTNNSVQLELAETKFKFFNPPSTSPVTVRNYTVDKNNNLFFDGVSSGKIYCHTDYIEIQWDLVDIVRYNRLTN